MYSDEYKEKIIKQVTDLCEYDELAIPMDNIREVVLTMAELGYIRPDMDGIKQVDWSEHLEQARAGLIKSTSQMLAMCGGKFSGGMMDENDHLLARLSNAYWNLLDKFVAMEKKLNQKEGKLL